jgi:hypothetical protein
VQLATEKMLYTASYRFIPFTKRLVAWAFGLIWDALILLVPRG